MHYFVTMVIYRIPPLSPVYVTSRRAAAASTELGIAPREISVTSLLNIVMLLREAEFIEYLQILRDP